MLGTSPLNLPEWVTLNVSDVLARRVGWQIADSKRQGLVIRGQPILFAVAICNSGFLTHPRHPAIILSANRGKAGMSLLLGSADVSVAFRPPVASSQSAM